MTFADKMSTMNIGNRMKITLKKATIILTCICLSAGCAPSTAAIFQLSPVTSAVDSELNSEEIITEDYQEQPGESDNDPATQPDYYNDEQYIENDPIPTDIAFAEKIEEEMDYKI